MKKQIHGYHPTASPRVNVRTRRRNAQCSFFGEIEWMKETSAVEDSLYYVVFSCRLDVDLGHARSILRRCSSPGRSSQRWRVKRSARGENTRKRGFLESSR